MTVFPYSEQVDEKPNLGLIVLQSDETIEGDFRRLMPDSVRWLVSRIRSEPEVRSETLGNMERLLSDAAGHFPHGMPFEVIGYGCTSAAAQIGPDRVAMGIAQGAETRAVSDPLSALIAACRAGGLNRLAILSPYVAPVSAKLRQSLSEAGIATPVFGTFAEATEAKVVRISAQSISDAAHQVMQNKEVDGLFLSCTNLRTLDVIPPLARSVDVPVFSSNLLLAWHMLSKARQLDPAAPPSRLLDKAT